MGESPRASTATRWPESTSSMAPRAMVRLPSERISTIKRATTGGSSPAHAGDCRDDGVDSPMAGSVAERG